MGSIQTSLAPKDAMLDNVWRDLAINVKARRARGLTSSVHRISIHGSATDVGLRYLS